MKVAYFSPMPPERSGIADYSALLVPELRKHLDVTVVARGHARSSRAADVALYHVGNDPEAHAWIVEALRARPGVVVLHDFVLHHLVAGMTIGRRDAPAYLAAMERDAGVPGRLLAHGVLEGRVPPPWERRPQDFPLVGEILDLATGLVVHSQYVEERAREFGYDRPIWRIPHPAWPVPAFAPAEVDGKPLFGCFGNLNASKRIPELFEAFAVVRERHPQARLLVVGVESPGFELGRRGIPEGVERIEYVDESRLWALLERCDAVVSLRHPTMGETSGVAVRALAAGKPLVVSDVGWFAELPDEVALKVPVDEREVEAVAATLELLASSEAVRLTMAAAAAAHARREHDVAFVAERYAEALEEAGGGGDVHDAVLRELAAAAADVGLAETAPVAERLAEIGLTDGHARPAQAVRRRVSSLPVGAWIAVLVVVSAVVRGVLTRQTVAPWIMVDELIYSELGKSFAATGHFLIRGEHYGAYGFVYPLLIAPAYRLFASVPDAYAAAKVTGAVVMSLAAVPAYFLARRVLPPWWSLGAAVLTVAVPSMLYTTTLMTETTFYPAFLLVALALVAMLQRPTPVRQLLVLAAFLPAFWTRAQAIALLPAILVAPVLLAWISGGGARSLRRFGTLYGVAAAAVILIAAVELARGHSPFDVLGQYAATTHYHYGVLEPARWLAYHVAELDLYLAVLPFAAFLLLLLVVRRMDFDVQAFIAATVAMTFFVAVQVAAFAAAVPKRIEERNLFYVVPFFLVALLVVVERRVPRWGRAASVAAVIAAALPAALPYQTFVDVAAKADTLALVPLWYLENTIFAPPQLQLAVALAAAALAVAFLALPQRAALVMPFAVLVWFALAQQPLTSWKQGFRAASVGAHDQGQQTPHRDWIDETVGRGADVAALWSGRSQDVWIVWQNEFFNRSVGRVYALAGKPIGNLPERKATIGANGVIHDARGRKLPERYALADESVSLRGRVIARDRKRGVSLYRLDGPATSTTKIEGLYPADTWSGPTVTYTRPNCSGGTLSVKVQSDPNIFQRKFQRLVASSGGSARTFRIPVDVYPHRVALALQPVGGGCVARFDVHPTTVPANVIESQDTRELGLHFSDFRYTPPRR